MASALQSLVTSVSAGLTPRTTEAVPLWLGLPGQFSDQGPSLGYGSESPKS